MESDKSDKIAPVLDGEGVAYWVEHSPQACLASREERCTTKDAKRRFLVILERSGGALTVTQMCRLARISRDTYYRWIDEDKAFKDAMSYLEFYRNMIAEDALWKKVLEGDGPSVRYYLSHRHPNYMTPSRRTAVQVSSRSWEYMYDEQVRLNNQFRDGKEA